MGRWRAARSAGVAGGFVPVGEIGLLLIFVLERVGGVAAVVDLGAFGELPGEGVVGEGLVDGDAGDADVADAPEGGLGGQVVELPLPWCMGIQQPGAICL